MDPTFGVNGRVIVDGPTFELAHGVAFQPDGKILATGLFATGTESERAFGVMRFLPDGSLDPSFGVDGAALTEFTPPSVYSAQAKRVAVQPDGKILVAGARKDLLLVRYLPDGTLDPSFNGTGVVERATVVNVSSQCWSTGLAVQPDGKILAGGTEYDGNRGYMCVVRYHANGSLDTAFADRGTFRLALAENSYAYSLALQGDGKILIAGTTWKYTIDERTATLVRCNADGSLDTSFNGTGVVTHRLGGRNSYATDVTLQPDGKVVVGGGLSSGIGGDNDETFHMMAARYNADGSLDTSFNGAGFTSVDFGVDKAEVSSVMLQEDRVVLVGYRNDLAGEGNYADFAVARFTADGAPDTSFNVTGKALTDFNNSYDSAYAGGVQPDGKIVAVGTNQRGVALARYNLNGASTLAEDDGGGVTQVGPPVIVHSPKSQVIRLRGMLNFYCSHGGAAPFSYQWYKDGTEITGATASSFTLPRFATAADIGGYTVRITNAEGSAESQVAYIAVVDTQEPRFTTTEGASLTLQARATVPSGSSVTYRWLLNYKPLADGPTYHGVSSPTLDITNIQANQGGRYTCVVTMTDTGSGQESMTHLTVTSEPEPEPEELAPVMDVPDLAVASVNERITKMLTAANKPTRFTATGLPPGISLDPLTGTLSGRPTRVNLVARKPAPYKVTLTASNQKGSSAPVTVDWLIVPVNAVFSGNFQGLVARSLPLNGVPANAAAGLGGSIRLTASKQGRATGVLTLGKQIYRFSTPIEMTGAGASGDFTLSLKRPKQSPLSLSLDLDSATSEVTGSVTDGADTVEIAGLRQTKGAAPAGRYNLVLPSTTATPRTGVLTVTAAGMAIWSGKLPDGTIFTGSGLTGPQGQVPLHQVLYRQTGSVQGWVQIGAVAAGKVEGSLSWLKGAPLLPRNSIATAPAEDITVTGQKAGR